MDLIRDYLLDAHPNPERIGCPDEKTLKDLAEDRLPLEEPARLHLASCSECVAEYLGYRNEWKQAESERVKPDRSLRPTAPFPMRPRQGLPKWAIPIAASLLVLAGGAALFKVNSDHSHRAVEVASNAPLDANVDLFEATTARGAGPEEDAAPLQEVALPAAVVHLHVTLPRFSQSGQYKIMVSTDRAGTKVVAMGTGLARENANKVTVNVTLDLRSAKPGAYFLATVRGSDNGTYYYPLQVDR